MELKETNLAVEWVPIGKLFCSPANPRLNDSAVPHVAASIRRFGWRQPVVARPSGEVVAGNTRLKAAKELGADRVPVLWFEGTDLEATSYAIADNRTHEFATWDEGALAKILQDLRAEDSLDGTGYTSSDIDELLAELGQLEVRELEDEGPEPVLPDATTRAGDLWLLGDHRLLCGNSTRADDVTRLMAGERAALLSTDPPYCVDYTGNDRPVRNCPANPILKLGSAWRSWMAWIASNGCVRCWPSASGTA